MNSHLYDDYTDEYSFTSIVIEAEPALDRVNLFARIELRLPLAISPYLEKRIYLGPANEDNYEQFLNDLRSGITITLHGYGYTKISHVDGEVITVKTIYE